MARQRKLSPERKEFLQELLRAYQPEDAQNVQNMFKDLLGDTLKPITMLSVLTVGLAGSLQMPLKKQILIRLHKIMQFYLLFVFSVLFRVL